MSWTKEFLELKRRGLSDAEALSEIANERAKLQSRTGAEPELPEKGDNGASIRSNARNRRGT